MARSSWRRQAVGSAVAGVCRGCLGCSAGVMFVACCGAGGAREAGAGGREASAGGAAGRGADTVVASPGAGLLRGRAGNT